MAYLEGDLEDEDVEDNICYVPIVAYLGILWTNAIRSMAFQLNIEVLHQLTLCFSIQMLEIVIKLLCLILEVLLTLLTLLLEVPL